MHLHMIDRIVPPCSFNPGHERDPFDPGNLLELFIVVVLLPLLLNAFQFWIVDNYLMSSMDAYKKELPSFSGLYGSFQAVEK